MSFIYSCIGDNSPENREHLEKIGYTVYKNPDKKYIHPYTNQYQQSIAIGWGFEDVPKGAIDCRNNPALFQAVTAVRDDSDYMQWFVCDKDYIDACDRDTDEKGSFKEWFDVPKKWMHFYHKASLTELQEHFK